MIRFSALLLLLPMSSIAQQRVNLFFFGGLANYSGDLQEKRFTTALAGPSLGGGISAVIVPKFMVRLGLQYGKVGGDDKVSAIKPLTKARNLNFKSSIEEFSAIADYSFIDIKKKSFTPYVFAGLAVFHFDPYTHDTAGRKYYLHNLGTEGQGLAMYPNRKPYKRTQIAIPFGGGFRFRINAKTVLSYEIGLRATTTDYLDDVSDRYADPTALLAAHGPKSVELSYRGGELKNGDPNYPINGQRGGPKYKDWYYFQGLTLSIGLFDKTGKLLERSPYGRTSCPKNVL